MVRHRWNIQDYRAGRVSRCLSCQGGGTPGVRERVAQAYKQAGEAYCGACYGTGFEGGFEPIVYVTWAMVTDERQVTDRSRAGAHQREEPRAEFSFEPALQQFDLAARVAEWEADGTTPKVVHGRFSLGAVDAVTIRTGPGNPNRTLVEPPDPRNALYEHGPQTLVGQRCGIEVLPLEHPWNAVPLTPSEEAAGVLMGEEHKRVWRVPIGAGAGAGAALGTQVDVGAGAGVSTRGFRYPPP